ncbi:MAG: DNA cytosine methyltransferase [Eubacteriales bacterium]|nr:DNA cytosine methyltransferase [Eubacteriales bacterium]
MNNIQLIYIDLFCGGGGTTTGVHRARLEGQQCAIVACCVNHDENAIRSHKSNHKRTLHFTEDITLLYNTSRMAKMVSHVNSLREKYPNAQVVLWASLECTNFSKAKGGQPRDADSRTLANHLFPYIEALKPDRIQIENVEEFMSWGEVDQNGKPISRLAGTDYQKWINAVCTYGYKFDYRILNAADFGALTSRKRYFGQFCREAEQIYWPEQTHAENPQNNLFGKELKKWRAVKEVLDFSDEGSSMFDRKKPLVDATWERVYAGLIKFVAGGKKEFLLKYNSMSSVAPSIENPCPAIPIIRAKDGLAFVSAYYGNGDNVSGIDKPSPTVTTKDRIALVTSKFLDMQYGNGTPSSVHSPAGTVTTNPKHHLISPQWIMNTNFHNVGSSIEAPAQTITANRKWHYLMNAQFAGNHPSFIKVSDNQIVYEIYDTDSEIIKKVKEFMALYGIIDIKMRMLRIPELKKIMGFPENYILVGTQAEQKKFIGNAVEVTVATALVEATANGVKQLKQAA